MRDLEKLAGVVTRSVQEFVSRAVEPLLARLKALEERPLPSDGRDGVDGLPGENGRDGVDGLPGADGRDGVDGLPGADGKDGADGLPGKDGEPGAPGEPGRDGIDGAPGERGLDGSPGADGVGLAGAVLGRDGQLVVTLTNGETRELGVVVGKDGINGRDGIDGKAGVDGERGAPGFSLASFDVVLKDDGRTIEFVFEDGETRYVRELAMPTMIYRGVFKDGNEYERGDTVTFGGSLWHCNGGEAQGERAGPTKDKPGEASKHWTLAAKRGRDGAPGRDGKPGEKGAPGPRGKDLTQIGPDGSKW
jgi:integrin beta 3